MIGYIFSAFVINFGCCSLKVNNKKSNQLRSFRTKSEKKHFETFQRTACEKPPFPKQEMAALIEISFFRFARTAG
jgi:hypothetical protein